MRYSLVHPQENGSLVDADTGDVYHSADSESLTARNVYTQSVTQCVVRCQADWRRVMPNRHGQLIAAFGTRVALRDFSVSYPGCATTQDAEAGEDAMMSAGLTRGMSPSGRALDYAQRTSPKVRQWRAAMPLQELALSAVYGGVQIGTYKRPPKKPRDGFVRVTEDIISSYPYTAAGPLPSIAHCRVERGMRKGAALWLIGGIQHAPVMFTRSRDGDVGYDPTVTGWYTPEECEYHAAHGRLDLQTIRASLTYSRSDRYLAGAIEHLFNARESHARGTAQRSVLKAAVNGLVGKFAAPISSWRMASERERNNLRRSRAYPLLTMGPVAIVDDPKLRGLYHRNTNGLWTALSYSRARVRLWERIDNIEAQGGRIRWVHTDCVIADVPQQYRGVYGHNLGDWRIVA